MQPSWPQTSSLVPQGNIVCCDADTAITVMSLGLYGPAPAQPMPLPASDSAYGVAWPLTEPATTGNGVRVAVAVAVATTAASACTGRGVEVGVAVGGRGVGVAVGGSGVAVGGI